MLLFFAIFELDVEIMCVICRKKPTINKFERQKVIVNHINEIHSTDLVDMTQYSKMNRGYKYIFTNIDVFSKIAYAFPLKSKKNTRH